MKEKVSTFFLVLNESAEKLVQVMGLFVQITDHMPELVKGGPFDGFVELDVLIGQMLQKAFGWDLFCSRVTEEDLGDLRQVEIPRQAKAKSSEDVQ